MKNGNKVNLEDLTSKEKEFLFLQLASRKDYFEEEMRQGVKDVGRLRELTFIMNTLDKGMQMFLEV